MDPSIMKLLEEDEDESMHSRADVEAFTAALNRDISGDAEASVSQPSDSDAGLLSQGSSSTSRQLFVQWQASCQGNNLADLIQPQEEHLQLSQEKHQQLQSEERHLSQVDALQKQGSGTENQHEQTEPECDQLLLQRDSSYSDQQQRQSQTNPHQFLYKNQVNMSGKNPTSCSIEDRVKLSENQQDTMQQLSSRQASTVNQTNNGVNQTVVTPTIPIQMLISKLHPHLDKDRSMQLDAIYNRLKNNEILKEDFFRVCKNIVGDQMLRQAVQQVHLQVARQTNHNLCNPQPQASSQQLPSIGTHESHLPASTVQMPTDKSHSTLESSNKKSEKTENKSDGKRVQSAQTSSNIINAINPEREMPMISAQPVKKLQHVQVPRTSFSMYGSTIGNFNAHACSRPSVGVAVSSLSSQVQNSQMRQAIVSQGMFTTHSGVTQPTNVANMSIYEMQNSSDEIKKLRDGSLSHTSNQPVLKTNQVSLHQPSANMPHKQHRSNALPSVTTVKQEVVDQGAEPQSKPQVAFPQGSSFGSGHADRGNPVTRSVNNDMLEKKSSKMGISVPRSTVTTSQISGHVTSISDSAMQMCSQNSSPTPPAAAETFTRTPLKKVTVGQKKPLEEIETSPTQQTKKQKTSGAFVDQSIEQLNDVTAVSGVNLREEEEQLLSAHKDESRASEAARRVVQEEEERLILQKVPLQKKLAEIISKCGMQSISGGVERCLSLCVEERLRGLICNLIRLSKQRIDIEKTRHQFVVTSDVRRQILIMNRKAKEEWEEKQNEEAQKLQKHNEADGSSGADADKDKEEGRSKTHKANKEEDDKMRATAANVAARAAVGGDDMLSKWQLMAEQARQKRERGLDGASGYQQGKTVGHKPMLSFGRPLKGQRESEQRGSSGGMRYFGRGPAAIPPKVTRSISTKDVIAVLEREPQMSKSSLMYRLYERIPE